LNLEKPIEKIIPPKTPNMREEKFMDAGNMIAVVCCKEESEMDIAV
jgi:hypothetical protein